MSNAPRLLIAALALAASLHSEFAQPGPPAADPAVPAVPAVPQAQAGFLATPVEYEIGH